LALTRPRAEKFIGDETEQRFINLLESWRNELINLPFQSGKYILKEISMKKIFYVLAALATIAIAAPAVAHDRPMHESRHHHIDRAMEMHHHHHNHMMRHLMHREGM
jgi:hypothetical protein